MRKRRWCDDTASVGLVWPGVSVVAIVLKVSVQFRKFVHIEVGLVWWVLGFLRECFL